MGSLSSPAKIAQASFFIHAVVPGIPAAKVDDFFGLILSILLWGSVITHPRHETTSAPISIFPCGDAEQGDAGKNEFCT